MPCLLGRIHLLIILEGGERIRHTYPGSLKLKGGKDGILTITTSRICFEDSRNGMSMNMPLGQLLDWDVKRKSIILYWDEPERGRFQGEFVIQKKDGRKVTSEELHYSIFYAKTDYHDWAVWDRPERMLDLWFCNNKRYRRKDYWKKLDKMSEDRTKIIKNADGTLYIHHEHMKRHRAEDITHDVDKKSELWKEMERQWDVWKTSSGPKKTTLQGKIKFNVEYFRDHTEDGAIRGWRQEKAMYIKQRNDKELNKIYPAHPIRVVNDVVHLGFKGGKIDDNIKSLKNYNKFYRCCYRPMVIASGLIRTYRELWYYKILFGLKLAKMMEKGIDPNTISAEELLPVQTMSKKTDFESAISESR